MASSATLTIKVGANVRDAAQQLQALGYNVETVKKKTDKANESASLWSQTLKKGSEDNVRKIVELGAKYLTFTTVVAGAYKGVKSCVTEALKENEEAQKKIDAINEAWREVKTNLGSALLDSITPALESLYKALEAIMKLSASMADGTAYNSMLIQARKAYENGERYDVSSMSYTDMIYATNHLPDNHAYKQDQPWIRQLTEDILARLAEYGFPEMSSTGASSSSSSSKGAGSALNVINDALEKAKEQWKDYYNSIKSYASDAFTSLNSYLDAYYDRQISDINKSEMAEEEKNAKINELEKKKFEAQQANSYANATISYAEGLIDIWSKYAESPWIGAALTALLTANTGLQFATISQQTYTPSLAEGGIVTSPTHAYIGEGAEHEAVIPLSKLEDFVNRDSEGGAIYLSITCNGNSSEADVFRAIERAQRTGLLPHWRYA